MVKILCEPTVKLKRKLKTTNSLKKLKNDNIIENHHLNEEKKQKNELKYFVDYKETMIPTVSWAVLADYTNIILPKKVVRLTNSAYML